MPTVDSYEFIKQETFRTNDKAKKHAQSWRRLPDHLFVVRDGRDRISVIWIAGIPYRVEIHPDYELKA